MVKQLVEEIRRVYRGKYAYGGGRLYRILNIEIKCHRGEPVVVFFLRKMPGLMWDDENRPYAKHAHSLYEILKNVPVAYDYEGEENPVWEEYESCQL